MFVRYTLNQSILTNITATTINIPINLEYQIVDNSELVEKVFVETEIEKSVNKILDYEKVRFIPVYDSLKNVDTITYNVNFLSASNVLQTPTYYSNIEINDNDIKYKKNSFKNSYLELSFFDNDNPMLQNLVSEIVIYSNLSNGDYYATTTSTQIAGQVKPANQIPVKFSLSNPLTTNNGYYEGYHIYTYKDEYNINTPPKSLYMKALHVNAKTGISTNLMTEPIGYPINELIYKQYTKYNLFRDNTGFYYSVDTNYSNNVTYNDSINPNLKNLSVNLYQIQVL
jgi:hypothetical protein